MVTRRLPLRVGILRSVSNGYSVHREVVPSVNKMGLTCFVACGIVADFRWVAYRDLEANHGRMMHFCLGCFPRRPDWATPRILGGRALVLMRREGFVHAAQGPCTHGWAGATVAVTPAQVLVYRLSLCPACLSVAHEDLNAARVESLRTAPARM